MTQIGKARLKISFGINKKLKLMICILLGIVLSIILLGTLLLFIMSLGKIAQFTDEKGRIIENSMAEKCFVEINGVKMGMMIKSKDISNPVLLFVHGGPGMPEYFLTQDYPTGMEDYFTVVYWDQRGAGLSYRSNIDTSTLTIDQYVQDTIAVTKYLQERFGQEKIYLMAHSWGTYFGIQTVQQAPELYKAYIGVGQITKQSESERLAYEYMLDYYAKMGDEKAIEKLKANDYLSEGYVKIRDDMMHRVGIGTMHNMKSVANGIFLASLKNKDYTLSEKINLWRGKMLLNQNPQLKMEEDLRTTVTKLEVPTYFFSGAFDYTVNHNLADEYLKKIEAPVKGFYLFDNSAHSPIFEEPDKVVEIMLSDVLNNTNNLATTK